MEGTALAGHGSNQAMPDVLVIGVGNAYRHDDALGLVLARRVKARCGGRVTVLEASGEGAALLEAWAGACAVIVLDAVSSGAAPGTVFRFDASAQPIPARFFHYSTHAFSVAEAVEMARALGRLPRTMLVYGVEGADFAAGEGLSPAVEAAATEVVEAVLATLEALATHEATAVHEGDGDA